MMTAYFVFTCFCLITFYWLYRIFLNPMIRIYRRYSDAQKVSFSDTQVKGKIVQSEYNQKVKSAKGIVLNMKITLPNLVGTEIEQKFRFVDTKPEEKRFEVGNDIDIIIDEKAPPKQQFKLVGGQYKLNFKIIGGLVFLLGLALYGLYVLLSPAWESAHGDFDTFLQFFDLEEVASLLYIFIPTGIFTTVLIEVLMKNITGKVEPKLIFYGYKAIAKITNVEETSLRVNDQPQVKFSFSFQAKDGRIYQGFDKEVIPLIDIGTVRDIQEKEVMYLADSPEKAVFTTKIFNNNQLGNANFGRFILFIFSMVLLGMIFSAIT